LDNKTKVIAEIGINHNGDVDVAKRLIDVAVIAGCDYVKFQKREPEECVPKEMWNKKRNTPWGEMAYIDYKKKIEFNSEEYDEIFEYCNNRNIGCFSSVWDLMSVKFMSRYTSTMKIPSALITNHTLLRDCRENSSLMIISTGMSTEDQVEAAIEVAKPDVVMHTNSTYPCPVDEINLNYIKWLADKYDVDVGYSGHEYGLVTTFAAVAMGCNWVERHITLDRNMWGSDQLSSVEPTGLIKLVRGIRDIDRAMGTGGPRKISPGELNKLKSLRGKK
tara:strand:+ start:594 stop:1421 length:828 start_codon:yes stop_codon:yes gene_type:complete